MCAAIPKAIRRAGRKEVYDYLIVGSGLFGAVCAHELTARGKKCLVLEKREHIGGNCYTETVVGIEVHRYGAHIFHTSDAAVWAYMNRFAAFNNFVNAPIARYRDELYNLPFNMNTFTKLWRDVFTPEDARRRIEEDRRGTYVDFPRNLEEQAQNLVGRTIYEKLVKGYTEKQWGRPCSALPAFIIRRLPVRFTFDNNYFTDRYQGIPEGGYTPIFSRLLEGSEVLLGVDFLEHRAEFLPQAERIVYTGAIDRYFDYRYGALEYRALRFETETLDLADFQGNAVVNYTDAEVPYTRIIEHKHFAFGTQEKTVITREYPAAWRVGDEPFYPVNDEKNGTLYEKYRALAAQEPRVTFGGRLGEYRYMDMHVAVKSALGAVARLEGDRM